MPYSTQKQTHPKSPTEIKIGHIERQAAAFYREQLEKKLESTPCTKMGIEEAWYAAKHLYEKMKDAEKHA